MKIILFHKIINKIFIAWVLFSACNITYSAAGDIEISNMAGPWPITIKACAHNAGAICSLKWRNKEFIDDYDHGRQLQSASSFDVNGLFTIEEFNPTEAGASNATNGINPAPSHSIFQGHWNTPNILATQSRMAFWRPVDGQVVSNHILNKQVTIGVHGLAHVIQYLTSFTIPAGEKHTFGQFATVTGYMPGEFSEFWTYDPASDTLAVLPDAAVNAPKEQPLPIIFSTPDQGWAMGIYSRDSPQSRWPTGGYGRWRFPATYSSDGSGRGIVKWNNVLRFHTPQNGVGIGVRGVYHFRSYVIVGSLQNVQDEMRQLYKILN